MSLPSRNSKLALGSVQFGLPYGVANTSGVLAEEVVSLILQRAVEAGVRVIDTASLYGEAEVVLGRCLPPGHAFDIVSKTPKFSGLDEGDSVRILRDAFEDSCAKLRVNALYGLLVHDANDLLGPNGEALWQEMSVLRAAGLVTKIGVSVYTGLQIDALLERYSLDLVQLPLSLLDQRLVKGGQLTHLHERGVEVHARSVFLQGALLMQPSKLPQHLVGLRQKLEGVAVKAGAHGIDTLTAALRYVASLPQIAAVVCGVDSVTQFEQLVIALQKGAPLLTSYEAEDCAFGDDSLLDPSQWKPA